MTFSRTLIEAWLSASFILVACAATTIPTPLKMESSGGARRRYFKKPSRKRKGERTLESRCALDNHICSIFSSTKRFFLNLKKYINQFVRLRSEIPTFCDERSGFVNPPMIRQLSLLVFLGRNNELVVRMKRFRYALNVSCPPYFSRCRWIDARRAVNRVSLTLWKASVITWSWPGENRSNDFNCKTTGKGLFFLRFCSTRINSFGSWPAVVDLLKSDLSPLSRSRVTSRARIKSGTSDCGLIDHAGVIVRGWEKKGFLGSLKLLWSDRTQIMVISKRVLWKNVKQLPR